MATNNEIVGPRLSADLAPFSSLRPEDGSSLTRFQITECDWSAELIAQICLDEGAISRATWLGAEFHGLQGRDLRLAKIEAASLKMTDCHLVRVEVESGRFSGGLFDGALWEDVEVRFAKLNLTSFLDCQLRNCRFTDCDFSEAVFDGCRLENVAFVGCNFARAEFRSQGKSLLKNVEFPNSELAEMKNLAGLKGASLTATQAVELAPLLAASLGIKLKG